MSLRPSVHRQQGQEADPAAKNGRLAIELHPQFMGAGVLRTPESAGQ